MPAKLSWLHGALIAALICGCAGGAMAQTATQSSDTGYSIPQSVDDAIGQLEKARGDMERVRKAGGDVAGVRPEVESAEKSVEDARVKALAKESGLTEDSIRSMRSSGKGWGVIAKETGVHPGTLGVGQDGKDVRPGKPGKSGRPDGSDGDDDAAAGKKGKDKPKSKKDDGKKAKEKKPKGKSGQDAADAPAAKNGGQGGGKGKK